MPSPVTFHRSMCRVPMVIWRNEQIKWSYRDSAGHESTCPQGRQAAMEWQLLIMSFDAWAKIVGGSVRRRNPTQNYFLSWNPKEKDTTLSLRTSYCPHPHLCLSCSPVYPPPVSKTFHVLLWDYIGFYFIVKIGRLRTEKERSGFLLNSCLYILDPVVVVVMVLAYLPLSCWLGRTHNLDE